MDVILVTDSRPALTRQTLESAVRNACMAHTYTTVIDDPDPTTELYEAVCVGAAIVNPVKCGIGKSKNLGAAAMKPWTSDKYLMFLDCDMYLLPSWDYDLLRVFDDVPEVRQLGGWGHPFNPPNSTVDCGGYKLHIPNAITGNCQVMRWSDWSQMGGFPDNCTGPGQSEDWALSQRFIQQGKMIACRYPFTAIHCGLTNCLGQPATGQESMRTLAEQQIATNGLTNLVTLE